MIDELLRMARQLGDASSHLHQAAEALSGPAVPMPPTLGLMSEGQVRVREQLLLAELEAPAAAATTAPAEPRETPATREQEREEYYDNLERFREWAAERGQPFQVAMRAALAAYMGQHPTLPPVRRKGPRGRPPKTAAEAIVDAVEKSIVVEVKPAVGRGAPGRPRGPMSAERRAKIAAGQANRRERLAAEQGNDPPAAKPAPAPTPPTDGRRRLSPEGRAAILAGVAKRAERQRAAKAAAGSSNATVKPKAGSITEQDRAQIVAGWGKGKAAAAAPVTSSPRVVHETRPRFAGIDAQPINVMRVGRKDED